MDLVKYQANTHIMNEIKGEYVVLNPETSDLHLLNQIAAYILEHCSGKSVGELAQEIYDHCQDKESLKIEMIELDCQEAIEKMIGKGLVFRKQEVA